MGLSFQYHLARIAGRMRPRRGIPLPQPEAPAPEAGISVVIPSRNGRQLLAAMLPAVLNDLASLVWEIVVVDNGSDDGTEAWLRATWPAIQIEVSADALSFARAVNLGIARARYSHICLLNNDMLIDPGFFASLGAAFDKVPHLFCATAQIRFPAGMRREETGKAVMARENPEDFPLRCDEPHPGEDMTWVLYGSGGCSVYDAVKLRALGSVDEAYEPAYVEDLDLGYRAWQRGWASVYVAGAQVEHRHRATTSRYYTEEEMERMMEINYLRFVARSVWDARLFRKLWTQAIVRLKLRAEHSQAAADALAAAPSLAIEGGPAITPAVESEEAFLALTNGSVSVFPGQAQEGQQRLLIATPSLHKRKRVVTLQRDKIIVAFADSRETPSPELLAACAEIVLVRRAKSREGNSIAFRAAIRETARKWRPTEARLETKGMAQYSAECAPARIILAD